MNETSNSNSIILFMLTETTFENCFVYHNVCHVAFYDILWRNNGCTKLY